MWREVYLYFHSQLVFMIVLLFRCVLSDLLAFLEGFISGPDQKKGEQPKFYDAEEWFY